MLTLRHVTLRYVRVENTHYSHATQRARSAELLVTASDARIRYSDCRRRYADISFRTRNGFMKLWSTHLLLRLLFITVVSIMWCQSC